MIKKHRSDAVRHGSTESSGTDSIQSLDTVKGSNDGPLPPIQTPKRIRSDMKIPYVHVHYARLVKHSKEKDSTSEDLHHDMTWRGME